MYWTVRWGNVLDCTMKIYYSESYVWSISAMLRAVSPTSHMIPIFVDEL
jgi:hypothetical protein